MSGTSSTQPGLPTAVRVLLPVGVILAALVLWEVLVRVNQIPHYILPAPTLVAQTLVENFESLSQSWWFTIRTTFAALTLAVVGGVLLAMLFATSRLVASILWPFAVIMQVTPVVAIAPLLFIYFESATVVLMICTWIVSFFPILTNTVTGLRAAEPSLHELFTLYRATRWQRIRLLLLPSSLPYFLSGLRIAGGLSLIAAVGAEFVAGVAGKNTGLASRVMEASFRGETPKMFASLVLISVTGVAIFFLFEGLSRWLLGGWHATERERAE
jgi:NitT/TauT family transport system permease protein